MMILFFIFQITLGSGYDLGINQILSVPGNGSSITSLSLSTYGADSSGGVRSIDWDIVIGIVELGKCWHVKHITFNSQLCGLKCFLLTH